MANDADDAFSPAKEVIRNATLKLDFIGADTRQLFTSGPDVTASCVDDAGQPWPTTTAMRPSSLTEPWRC